MLRLLATVSREYRMQCSEEDAQIEVGQCWAPARDISVITSESESPGNIATESVSSFLSRATRSASFDGKGPSPR